MALNILIISFLDFFLSAHVNLQCLNAIFDRICHHHGNSFYFTHDFIKTSKFIFKKSFSLYF